MSNIYKRNITLYYITRVFVALRFIIPIWVTFFLRIITFEQMAIGEVVALVIGTIFELPSGVLADLIGRRFTVAIGFIIQGAGYVLLSTVTSFPQYLIYYSICAFGNSFVSGAEEALVYDSLKQDNKLSLYSHVKSIESVIYRITLLISTIIGGYLYKIKTFLPYLLTGITIFIAGIIYLFSREPYIDTEKFSLKSYLKTFKLGFMESFKDKSNTMISIYYILIFAGAFMLMAYFEQPYTYWLGFNEVQIGWIFGLITFIRIFTVMLSVKIEKKISRKYINFFLPFITGLFLMLSFKNTYWGLFVLTAESIVIAYRFIFTQKAYNEVIDSKYRASAISTVTMFINIVHAVFVYFLSRLFLTRNIGYSFNVIGLLFICSAVLSLYFKTNDK